MAIGIAIAVAHGIGHPAAAWIEGAREALAGSRREELLQLLQPSQLIHDERLEVLAVDRGDRPRHPVRLEEGVQAGDGIEVGP
jgi:hypothetical protein